MTKILKGKCFNKENAWKIKLCKPSEAGKIINNWLILDEGQPKINKAYYRCVNISYIDIFENNNKKYFVSHFDKRIIPFEILFGQ